MTGLEKWKKELIETKNKQIKEIKKMPVEQAVMIISQGLDCSKCIHHSEVDGMIILSHECKMRHCIDACKEGIKAYLESEVE